MGGIGWSMFDAYWKQTDRGGNVLEIFQVTSDYVSFDVLLADRLIMNWEE